MRDVDGQRLVFHGAVVLLLGLLAGVPFGAAITDGWGEEAIHAWRVAHTGLVGGGVALIAIGGAAHRVRLGPGAAAWLVGSLVASIYAGVFALGVGPILGVRGLEPTPPLANQLAFGANLVLALGSLIAAALLVRGAWAGASDTRA
jgi:hypothetical protein